MTTTRAKPTFLGSFLPSTVGGRTRGIPKQLSFKHSSPSIAHPLSRRFPISDEALSDCSRLRIVSGVSAGGENPCELSGAETSVRGVSGQLASWVEVVDLELEERLDDRKVVSLGTCEGPGRVRLGHSLRSVYLPPGPPSQEAQNWTGGVMALGERIKGQLQFAFLQVSSVRI